MKKEEKEEKEEKEKLEEMNKKEQCTQTSKKRQQQKQPSPQQTEENRQLTIAMGAAIREMKRSWAQYRSHYDALHDEGAYDRRFGPSIRIALANRHNK